jgi:hypothetical protein
MELIVHKVKQDFDIIVQKVSPKGLRIGYQEKKKMANRTSHRYNRLPLLPSDPGGVQQELVVPICRCKDTIDI